MVFIIDIDGTILYSDTSQCTYCGRTIYELRGMDNVEVKRINELYDDGHTIILHTGRGWDAYNITKKQLEKCRVKYHELVMGKPLGIYVDKEAIKTLEDVN